MRCATSAPHPIRRFTTSVLIGEMWSARHNLTPYDATYVVLARRAGAALLTLDKRLIQAPGLGVDLLTVRDEAGPGFSHPAG